MSTYEIEQAGRETIVGKLRAVGGATGDVPTQQANGELLQAPGGGSGPQQVTVEVSSAQIKALFTTPVVLIPGTAGKVAVVTEAAFVYVAGATPYTDNGGNVVVGTNGLVIWTEVGFAGVWDQATSQFIFEDTNVGANNSFALAGVSGEDVVLFNDTANPTLGDGTLLVTFSYFLAPAAP